MTDDSIIPTPALCCLDISPDYVHVEVEKGGVYRVTTRSLTGMGTHTKWYYPEEPEFSQEDRGGMETVPNESRRQISVAERPSFNSCIDGTLSTISSRGTPGIEQDNEYFDDYDMDACSDTTEIIDEEAENQEFWRLKTSRDEEPLPNLPYERIMMRISREPTVVLDDVF